MFGILIYSFGYITPRASVAFKCLDFIVPIENKIEKHNGRTNGSQWVFFFHSIATNKLEFSPRRFLLSFHPVLGYLKPCFEYRLLIDLDLPDNVI